MVIAIDTDIGSDVDDALALLLAIRSPEIELKAVTTVYGDVETRAKIAKKMLDAAGMDVPVGAGIGEPITPEREVWHTGYEGHGILEPEDYARSVEDFGIEKDGVELLCRTIYENPGICVITIGALTNLATALEREPQIKDKIGMVYSMAGAVRYPAFLNEKNLFEPFTLRRVEHNIACDPVAAKKVFDSGLQITMVPLDVTTRVKITRKQAEPLREKDRLSRYVWNMLEIWLTYINSDQTFLHDPLTLAVAMDNSFVKMVEGGIEVDEYGRTNPKREGICRICYDVDAERFERFYLNRVLG